MIFININSVNLYCQYNEKEIIEIKNIFNDFTNGSLVLPIYLERDTILTLPKKFSTYNEYMNLLKSVNEWSEFSPNKYLNINKSDCKNLNDVFLNNHKSLSIDMNILKSNKVKVLTDTLTFYNNDSYRKFIKPIFFRNYKRCFFACFIANVRNSFFLIKVDNHWIFDKIYSVVEED